MLGRPVIECVGCVGSSVERDIVLSISVPIIVVNWDSRAINRQLLKIRSTMSAQLGVQVRVDASLQKGVFGEIDSADDVSRLELEKCQSFCSCPFRFC